ncbi:hypothetical protein ICQ89_004428 [Salmonella enterica]|jgi:hypothetical protein|uniref:Restriction endonuclease subunit S n=5 Tax=Enterobacterales TaxID=91347 RepID=A0A377BCF1_ECOLX|nr:MULTISPECIES: hypothetical protein [Enterobacterales]EAA3032413.1 hypothetical protein [Salmonella enterica subsp. enterica serovar Kisangani]EAA5483642.1 hypothetical protein [Salmonella enterica subsp. enterica]EBG8243091.1 hypothetical protein [Salmonella enterica subsp. enterica serovar Infantis]EBN0205727.1 hypothetical protein [Salmonella enterica subsp. enterica serovar Enteritidis]EBQ8675291.1 hypothetical protein [Salmonella enterica subsp. enterica serovar Weltevreden]EBQ9931623.
MKLSDVATIKTNFPDADFWIVRRGSLKTVGEPSYTFNPESIGVKVTRPDLVLSRYLYYCFLHLHQSKVWEPVATGSLSLVNIKVSDVKNIVLEPR